MKRNQKRCIHGLGFKSCSYCRNDPIYLKNKDPKKKIGNKPFEDAPEYEKQLYLITRIPHTYINNSLNSGIFSKCEKRISNHEKYLKHFLFKKWNDLLGSAKVFGMEINEPYKIKVKIPFLNGLGLDMIEFFKKDLNTERELSKIDPFRRKLPMGQRPSFQKIIEADSYGISLQGPDFQKFDILL